MSTGRRRTVPLAAAVATVAAAAAIGSIGFFHPGRVAASARGSTGGTVAAARASGLIAVPVDQLRKDLDCPAYVGVVIDSEVPLGAGPTAGAVVTGHCDAPAGNPPSGVYAVLPSPAGPTVRSVLVDPAQEVLVTGVSVQRDVLRVRGRTYSSHAVPLCCPDRPYARSWAVALAGRLTPAG
ncbi:MAG TPA: hypothetical protein VIM19_06370 [Actinomycetes bacterium]